MHLYAYWSHPSHAEVKSLIKDVSLVDEEIIRSSSFISHDKFLMHELYISLHLDVICLLPQDRFVVIIYINIQPQNPLFFVILHDIYNLVHILASENFYKSYLYITLFIKLLSDVFYVTKFLPLHFQHQIFAVMLYKFHQDLQYLFDDGGFFHAVLKEPYQFKYPFNEKSVYYQPILFQHQKNLKAITITYFFR